ncbi:hypothetical protein [Zobellia roscoffensis]|uniref:hypothetical protein n=1 Tax=Zobellia roscoffensis TaxID=2779508 RepID=UPI00188B1569|nr:hypothetical protein [Zobellia roscoffensis]
MRRLKYTELQVVFSNKQVVTVVDVQEVYRKIGILVAIYYSWKKKYGSFRI